VSESYALGPHLYPALGKHRLTLSQGSVNHDILHETIINTYTFWIENTHHWNYERPHQGIDYLIPCELYFNDKV